MGDGSGQRRARVRAVDDGRGADARYSVRGGDRSRRVASDREPGLLQGTGQTDPGTPQPEVRQFLSTSFSRHLNRQ